MYTNVINQRDKDENNVSAKIILGDIVYIKTRTHLSPQMSEVKVCGEIKPFKNPN